jgi:hypothetical protein
MADRSVKQSFSLFVWLTFLPPSLVLASKEASSEDGHCGGARMIASKLPNQLL